MQDFNKLKGEIQNSLISINQALTAYRQEITNEVNNAIASGNYSFLEESKTLFQQLDDFENEIKISPSQKKTEFVETSSVNPVKIQSVTQVKIPKVESPSSNSQADDSKEPTDLETKEVKPVEALSKPEPQVTETTKTVEETKEVKANVEPAEVTQEASEPFDEEDAVIKPHFDPIEPDTNEDAEDEFGANLSFESDTLEEDVRNLANEKESELSTSPPKKVEYLDVSTKTKRASFVAETSLLKSDFIYNAFIIHALHEGDKHPTEIKIYVAPLDIPKKHSSSIPILVHLLCAGEFKTFSSLDTIDEGQNILQTSIRDFSFMIRGKFDENGFSASIYSSGDSGVRNDTLEFIETDKGGKYTNQYNGHIKFKVDNNMVEVFPLFFNNDDTEYIVVHTSEEFLDYHPVAKYAEKKAMISIDNKNRDILAFWEGNSFNVEVL